tara:strand:- start:1088 stop:2236 length:1149 start_codon:yes stop_codon:yes gene_type:complete
MFIISFDNLVIPKFIIEKKIKDLYELYEYISNYVAITVYKNRYKIKELSINQKYDAIKFFSIYYERIDIYKNKKNININNFHQLLLSKDIFFNVKLYFDDKKLISFSKGLKDIFLIKDCSKYYEKFLYDISKNHDNILIKTCNSTIQAHNQTSAINLKESYERLYIAYTLKIDCDYKLIKLICKLFLNKQHEHNYNSTCRNKKNGKFDAFYLIQQFITMKELKKADELNKFPTYVFIDSGFDLENINSNKNSFLHYSFFSYYFKKINKINCIPEIKQTLLTPGHSKVDIIHLKGTLNMKYIFSMFLDTVKNENKLDEFKNKYNYLLDKINKLSNMIINIYLISGRIYNIGSIKYNLYNNYNLNINNIKFVNTCFSDLCTKLY